MEKITKSSDKVLIDPNEPLILPDGTALVGRVEWFLYALCCLDYQNLPTPMSRIEEFANALITGEVPNIEPQSRAEQFFLAILDGNVSNLPQPQSRSEVLLDKLARGEFDLSDVEPIQSSYELLLAYLIKNGGIGNIDYVLYEFSEAMKTMYNTVEKPFKSLELSGNTLVNCVLEDTENDDYTSFDEDYSGTSFTINETSEGAIKSAILKGKTVNNLWANLAHAVSVQEQTDDTIIEDYSEQYTRVTFGESQVNSATVVGIRTTQKLQVNKTYYINTFVFDALDVTDSFLIRDNSNNINLNTLKIEGYPPGQILSFTTQVETNFLIFYYFAHTRKCGAVNYGKPFYMPKRFIISDKLEDVVNQEFFEGMQSVKMPVLTTTGKNLFDGEIEVGYYNINNGTKVNSDTRVRSANYIKISPNRQIIIKGSKSTSKSFYKIFYDRNKNFIDASTSEEVVTTPENAQYMTFYSVDINASIDELIQIEYGTQATSYEPYKSNILSTSEDIELRGIDEVRDELNVLTGEKIERISKIVLDGSEETWDNNYETTNTMTFRLPLPNKYFYIDQWVYTGLKNDCGFEQVGWFYIYSDQVDKECYGVGDNNNIYIRVLKSRLNSVDVNGFKSFLSTNPITIQYVLATESIKTVDLNVVDQNNAKIDKIHVFDGITHVNASSDELTPTVNISKSVSYPTIIKPNTKYTVDLKRNDKPLTVNLGGTEVTFTSGETRKTITTPSTLTNDKLSYYGVGAKCNEIMLIEGEVEGNVDYFTGMQSVVMQNQMPILSTVGKNLFDGVLEKGNFNGGTNNIRSSTFALEELRTYTISNDKNYSANVVFHDDNNQYISEISASKLPYTFTTPLKTKYVWIRTWSNQNDLTVKFQIEKGSIATTYEPYKSSILSLPEEVVLRSLPNGVCDTFNTRTGVYTQRIGEAVVNGSENWQLNNTEGTTTQRFFCFMLANSAVDNNTEGTQQYLCDRLRTITWSQTCKLGITINGGGVFVYNNSIEYTVSSVKQWLSQNPVKLQYELVTPIIKTVDLTVVDQDGNTIPKIKSYDGVTHLEVTVPKQSLLPSVSAEVATDNSKDMSSLTTKHQEISEAQSTIENGIQSQSDEIDTALMATTEIFESILE